MEGIGKFFSEFGFQMISNLISIGLLIFTYKYFNATRNLEKTTREQANISQLPILEVKKNPHLKNAKIGLENKGIGQAFNVNIFFDSGEPRIGDRQNKTLKLKVPDPIAPGEKILVGWKKVDGFGEPNFKLGFFEDPGKHPPLPEKVYLIVVYKDLLGNRKWVKVLKRGNGDFDSERSPQSEDDVPKEIGDW